ncbi:hypothetical protein LPB67_08940 [Undibacterium sp. Jales W-56]|uniref:hypothetical protein n=1 Tax=Undibacterium sp. Jales W-56 TaxID=2897325 RepID=UPI0021CF9B5B|nr:hypothetical protein [Undibacterium sp. Jales W-56]MCU6433902.1 hypothetical protein [Undibacterium sp. Jales W-56]
MSFPEMPLVRQTTVFVQRLITACRRFSESKYRLHRRVNWSYRYAAAFYQSEASYLMSDIDTYLAGDCLVAPQVENVYAQKLSWKQAGVVLLKVFAHWSFRLLGRFADRRIRSNHIQNYRKAYVDDIELVFDITQSSVIRAVYPFPISFRRQLRYLNFLRKKGYLFKLAGHSYCFRDLLNFVLRRDVESLQRMESRAQILHALEVAALGVRNVQLSDEFDIGSLDFARTLARRHVHVVNSAHGVGKYLPVHAYAEFHILTQRQKEYYFMTHPCNFVLRKLNEKAPAVATSDASSESLMRYSICFVLLSAQSSRGIGEKYLVLNEDRITKLLGDEFENNPEIGLYFRPHPNNHTPVVPRGFKLLPSLEQVNNLPNVIFASFNSTCQIDPAFKGRKILLRGEMMYPELWFDDNEEMLHLDQLVALLRKLALTACKSEAVPAITKVTPCLHMNGGN